MVNSVELKIYGRNNVFLLTFQIMNQILKKGLWIFFIINPLVTYFLLSTLASVCMHEAVHLALSRKLYHHDKGKVYFRGGMLSVDVILGECVFYNVMICLGPSLLALLAFGVLCLNVISAVYLVPWFFNALCLNPFARDMKALY